MVIRKSNSKGCTSEIKKSIKRGGVIEKNAKNFNIVVLK